MDGSVNIFLTGYSSGNLHEDVAKLFMEIPKKKVAISNIYFFNLKFI